MKERNREPVRLRRKTLKDGSESLYLDVYIGGRRQYEFLKLYLVSERRRGDREKNRNTIALAEAIRAKRVVELRNDEYGFKTKQDGVGFLDYYEEQMDRRKGKTRDVWLCCLKILFRYKHRDVLLNRVTKEWLLGVKELLEEEGLSDNSRFLYFSKVRACVNSAIRDGLIDKNPLVGVPNFPKVDTERNFLTLEELRLLATSPAVKSSAVRRVFLFSCLTGLRWSDINALQWEEVKEQGGYTRIVFKQKKTGGLEYMDLNGQAVQLMGERKEGQVFVGLPTLCSANRTIRYWAKKTGIKKHITFHCARHTFAIMMLDLGVDIYTVSKLLGHRNIATTQVYAKVLDKNKQSAVGRIPSIL